MSNTGNRFVHSDFLQTCRQISISLQIMCGHPQCLILQSSHLNRKKTTMTGWIQRFAAYLSWFDPQVGNQVTMNRNLIQKFIWVASVGIYNFVGGIYDNTKVEIWLESAYLSCLMYKGRAFVRTADFRTNLEQTKPASCIISIGLWKSKVI